MCKGVEAHDTMHAASSKSHSKLLIICGFWCARTCVCVRVCSGVCYFWVCLLVCVAEARQYPYSLGSKPYETRDLAFLHVRCGAWSYLWFWPLFGKCLSIKNYSTESGFLGIILLYHMTSLKYVCPLNLNIFVEYDHFYNTHQNPCFCELQYKYRTINGFK